MKPTTSARKWRISIWSVSLQRPNSDIAKTHLQQRKPPQLIHIPLWNVSFHQSIGTSCSKVLSMSLCKVLPAAQDQASPNAVSTASTHLSAEHRSQVSQRLNLGRGCVVNRTPWSDGTERTLQYRAWYDHVPARLRVFYVRTGRVPWEV